MKKILFSTFALVLLLMVSCKPEPIIEEDRTATIEVNFVAEYQNSPLIIFSQDYAYPELGNTFNVKKFQFLLTDLALLKSGTGDETELAEVELVEFTGMDTEDAAIKGTAFAYESIPVGEYSGIRFGLGVNRELNKAESVSNYAAGEPLTTGFWPGWGSYIFSMMEGNFDMTGDGLYDDMEEDFSYSLHTGSNEAYRVVTLNTPISVTKDDDNIIKIVIDYGKILQTSEGQVYDIIETPESHNISNFDAIIELMDNFKDAFVIR